MSRQVSHLTLFEKIQLEEIFLNGYPASSYNQRYYYLHLGHTKSWELGQPGLLAQCEDKYGQPQEVYGPMVSFVNKEVIYIIR